MTRSACHAVAAVSDTIIPRTDTPGAIDVGVPALFDALLVKWAAPAHAEMLRGALVVIDTEARRQAGRPFATLSAPLRQTLLAAHDVRALAPAPQAPSDAEPHVQSLGALMNAAPVIDPAYAKLKELIVVLYYYSEPALTRDLAYDQVPGEWQPSIPITPMTRQSGGAGLF